MIMLACGRTSVCSRWLIVVSCRLLLVHQTNEEVVAGRFPVGRELAVELCALIAQVSHNLMFFSSSSLRYLSQLMSS